jgi:hypothetical protein
VQRRRRLQNNGDGAVSVPLRNIINDSSWADDAETVATVNEADDVTVACFAIFIHSTRLRSPFHSYSTSLGRQIFFFFFLQRCCVALAKGKVKVCCRTTQVSEKLSISNIGPFAAVLMDSPV